MSNFWEKWHDFNARSMRPITTWFCEASRAAASTAGTPRTPGMTVLDVACGTGLPSLALAECVRPGGRVMATDISEDMVAAVLRKAEAAAISNLEARQMDLTALDFPDASFDAVTCSFCLMFCKDPISAANELRRVLKPGGRLAVTVWGEPAKNPYFTTLFGPMARFAPSPPDPTAPGPFRLGAPGELERVLRAAGLGEVSVASREVMFEFDSVDQHWEISHELATPLRNMAARLSDADRARLQQDIVEGLRPYVVDGRVRVHNTALCGTGVI